MISVKDGIDATMNAIGYEVCETPRPNMFGVKRQDDYQSSVAQFTVIGVESRLDGGSCFVWDVHYSGEPDAYDATEHQRIIAAVNVWDALMYEIRRANGES